MSMVAILKYQDTQCRPSVQIYFGGEPVNHVGGRDVGAS